MKLDSKILPDKKPLTYFDAEQGYEFIGKECYFSDYACKYEDLDTIENTDDHTLYIKDFLKCVDSDCQDRMFKSRRLGVNYRYCLPCEWVEEKKEPEKKYRPFTLAEWVDQHEIGDIIHYRCKSQKIELRHMYMGYAHGIGTDIKNTTSGTLTLGVASYCLDYLFEDYEICIYGEWQPFGKECEE